MMEFGAILTGQFANLGIPFAAFDMVLDVTQSAVTSLRLVIERIADARDCHRRCSPLKSASLRALGESRAGDRKLFPPLLPQTTER